MDAYDVVVAGGGPAGLQFAGEVAVTHLAIHASTGSGEFYTMAVIFEELL